MTKIGEVYASWAPIHTLGFSPSIRVFLSDIYSRLCYCLWTNNFRLTDNGRLFSSLYLVTFDIKTNTIGPLEGTQLLVFQIQMSKVTKTTKTNFG